MSRRSSRWRGHRSISAQVCELADHGLLGEGLLPTLREVLASGTASKDATIIPCGAYVEAALFEDASLAKRRGPDDYRRQRCRGGAACAPARLGNARRLTPYVRVLDLSFSSPPARGAHAGAKVDLQVQKRGRVDAVGYRWRMDLGFGESVSNEEDAADFQDHWWQMAQPLDAPFDIGPGVPFSLKATHTDTDVVFDVFFDAGFVTSASALCACGLHVGYSTQRLASLPNDHRALAERCLRGDDTAEVWDIGDGGVCALACLRAGCDNAVAWCADARDALHASNVARRFELALSIFSDVSEAPSTDAEVIVVTGEPYYHDLEGHPVAGALRFWRRCAMLRELFAGRRVRVAPGRAVVIAVAIRSDDLKKAYGPLAEEICGVDQTAASEAWLKARRELVPIDLDEYDGDIVAEREITSFRFSDGFPARAIEGEVSLSCAADVVGLVVRYEDGFEGSESRCLVRFDAGPRLRYSLGLDGRCRLDVVSGSD